MTSSLGCLFGQWVGRGCQWNLQCLWFSNTILQQLIPILVELLCSYQQQHASWTSTWPQLSAQTTDIQMPSSGDMDHRHQPSLWQQHGPPTPAHPSSVAQSTGTNMASGGGTDHGSFLRRPSLEAIKPTTNRFLTWLSKLLRHAPFCLLLQSYSTSMGTFYWFSYMYQWSSEAERRPGPYKGNVNQTIGLERA